MSISFQHCDSGAPITVQQDPVTGGWEACLDDQAEEWGVSPDDMDEARRECAKIVSRLQQDLYLDEDKAAAVICEEFGHNAEAI